MFGFAYRCAILLLCSDYPGEDDSDDDSDDVSVSVDANANVDANESLAIRCGQS